jgi:hypothetical protein
VFNAKPAAVASQSIGPLGGMSSREFLGKFLLAFEGWVRRFAA